MRLCQAAFLNALLILRALFAKDIKAVLAENTEMSSVVRAEGTVLQQAVTSQEALAGVPRRVLGSVAWICLARMALAQRPRPRAKMQSQFSPIHFSPLNVFISVLSK